MKMALSAELQVQREAHLHLAGTALRAGEAESKSRLQSRHSPSATFGRVSSDATPALEMIAWSGRRQPRAPLSPTFQLAAIAGRLSRYHRQEAERLARRRRAQHDDDEPDDRGRSRHR
jgi:hypothetical protein